VLNMNMNLLILLLPIESQIHFESHFMKRKLLQALCDIRYVH
jgi:hypothetical protein